MAFPAKDGKMFSNKDSQRSHDAMTSAKPPAAEPDGDEGGPPPIESDPEAMQCVQLLAQKGYTGEEVANAVDQLQGGGMNAPA